MESGQTLIGGMRLPAAKLSEVMREIQRRVAKIRPRMVGDLRWDAVFQQFAGPVGKWQRRAERNRPLLNKRLILIGQQRRVPADIDADGF